ncbi:MAG TPA: anthranilate phosphoribosyltransferase [bacterium]|nr:anthranilate phosphoribosyltransferase [bacterium]
MHSGEKALKEFGREIQRLIDGQDMSRERSYEMFREVLLGAQPELQQGAFLAALVAKGETPQEIAGAWQAIDELDTVHVDCGAGAPLVENSGTGMDKLKTFNVSSAAAIIAAACGARMARHGARALTSSCGMVDILEAVGIGVECGVSVVEKSIREEGIGLFNGMSAAVHPRALFRILSRIRFGSTLNIAASLAHPCRPGHAVRGVYDERLVPKVAGVMREIGYRRGIVVHGFDNDRRMGMDELSVLGESVGVEFFPDGTVSEFSIAPEDAGLKRREYSDIAATGDIREESRRFVSVVAGRGPAACHDLACLNAGAVLYCAGVSDTIVEGVAAANEAVMSGRALAKLAGWVRAQNADAGEGCARFEALLRAQEIRLN